MFFEKKNSMVVSDPIRDFWTDIKNAKGADDSELSFCDSILNGAFDGVAEPLNLLREIISYGIWSEEEFLISGYILSFGFSKKIIASNADVNTFNMIRSGIVILSANFETREISWCNVDKNLYMGEMYSGLFY